MAGGHVMASQYVLPRCKAPIEPLRNQLWRVVAMTSGLGVRMTNVCLQNELLRAAATDMGAKQTGLAES
jgi:hypothetical protein